MGFIKELFIGRKIYLTTDLPKDRIYYGNVNESPMRGIIGRELLL